MTVNSIARTIVAAAAQASTPKTSAREMLLNKIGSASPDQRRDLEEKLSTLDAAVDRMKQARRDMQAERREAAKQKIARIKAQIQALELAGGGAESKARKLARLARELASAVKDYKAGSGAGAASAAAPVSTEVTSSAAPTPQEGAAVAQQPEAAAQDDESNSAARREEDRKFAEEARRLLRQIKNMMEREERKMDNKAPNATQGADDALQRAERDLQAILSPAPTVTPIIGMGVNAPVDVTV